MAAPDIGAGTEPYARRWWALSVLCLSLLIVFIGNSSLNGLSSSAPTRTEFRPTTLM